MNPFSSLFRAKQNINVPSSESLDDRKDLMEIKREDFVDDSNPTIDELPIPHKTGMPIDAIYAYIERDHEEQGYQDAMCNADCSYKESKKVILQNGLKRLFEQIELRYKGDLRTLEVQIEITEQQGMINTVAALKARKEIFIEHMSTIKQMDIALDRGEDKMLSMVNSYERGFLKGLATQSNSLLQYDNE